MPEEFSVNTKMGPLTLWQWGLGVGGALFLMVKFGLIGKLTSGGASSNPGQGTQFSSSQSQQSTNPLTGDTTTSQYSASGNGYLPGMLTTQASPMPYSLGDIYVNTNVATNDGQSPAGNTPSYPGLNLPNVRNSQGRDEGQYRFGADELAYLQSMVGQYGITNAVVKDVQDKYNAAVASMGQSAANTYHYAWYGPGQVSMVPEFSSSGGTVIYPQTTTQSSTQPGPIDTASSGTGNAGQPPTYPGTTQPYVPIGNQGAVTSRI